MANTTQLHAPRETTETASDSEAWKVAAATRKYHIHDGKVWSGGAGMLFSLDPLPGFASLPLAVQPMVFQAVAQYVTNRVGQVAEGDVQAAISDCLLNGKAPNANDNNAFERHYHNTVDDRVLAADLHSIRKTVTAGGNVRFEGERTKAGHADRFWAGAIGNGVVDETSMLPAPLQDTPEALV